MIRLSSIIIIILFYYFVTFYISLEWRMLHILFKLHLNSLHNIVIARTFFKLSLWKSFHSNIYNLILFMNRLNSFFYYDEDARNNKIFSKISSNFKEIFVLKSIWHKKCAELDIKYGERAETDWWGNRFWVWVWVLPKVILLLSFFLNVKSMFAVLRW